jgi:tRNA (adenine22-N1)-methyltransferase
MKTFKRINKLTENVLMTADDKFDGEVVVADIGTDHGYLAESLSKSDKIKKIIATDISEKSLSKLQNLIKKEGLEKIDTFVGDGLVPIDSADICAIAGIGGFEIMSMLKNQNKNADGTVKCRYFVLQPAQNVIELRKWLSLNKISVLRDVVVEDAERFYPILTIDVSEKKKLKSNIFNIWLGRDNDLKSQDFVAFLIEMKKSLEFIQNLPKLRIFRDKALREKYKLFHLIEKLLKV